MSLNPDKLAATAASPNTETKIEPPTAATATSPITTTQGKSSTAAHTNLKEINDSSVPVGGTSSDGDKINTTGTNLNIDILSILKPDPSVQLASIEGAFTEAQTVLERLGRYEKNFLTIKALIFALRIERLITTVGNRAKVDTPRPMFPGRKFHNRIMGHCDLAREYSSLLMEKIPRLKPLRYDESARDDSLFTFDELKDFNKTFGLLLDEMKAAVELFIEYRKATVGFKKSKRRTLEHDLLEIGHEIYLWVIEANMEATRMGIP